MKKITVAVLMGGPSSEHEVSLKSGAMMAKALDRKKYVVIPVVISKSGIWNIQNKKYGLGAALDFLKRKVNVALLGFHGAFGEDGRVQGLLEWAGIPYTGSGVLASALAMDKERAAEIFAHHGIRVPHTLVISREIWKQNPRAFQNLIAKRIGYPCFVKPSNAGSSVGISKVKKSGELAPAMNAAFKEGERVLVQEFVKGIEVTCPVLEDPRKIAAPRSEQKSFYGASRSRGKWESAGWRTIALPVIEIVPKGGTFFDYKAKYSKGGSDEIVPARISKSLTRRVQELAIQAHTVLGCTGISRTDMIIRGKEIVMLETNTLPGMTEGSLVPKATKAAGIAFPKLLDTLIKAAIKTK